MNRGERRRRTKNVIRRRKKVLSQRDRDNRDIITTSSITPRNVGRCKHMDPRDCGKTRCALCSHCKVMKIATMQEIISMMLFQEGIKEIEEN